MKFVTPIGEVNMGWWVWSLWFFFAWYDFMMGWVIALIWVMKRRCLGVLYY
jgi:hypothetical protein